MPLRYSLSVTAPRTVVGSFAALMALGALMLKLPVSTQDGISWLDAVFVSVSAVSVTGLSTVDFPQTFTAFGEVVVMVLIQLGGLGIMTFTTLGALIIGRRVGFGELLTLRTELGLVDSPRNALSLITQIAGITLLVEAETNQLKVSRGGHSPWLATSAKYARTRGRQVREVRLVSTGDRGFTETALYGFLDVDLIEDPTGRLR